MQRELNDLGGAKELALYRLKIAKEDLAAAEVVQMVEEYLNTQTTPYNSDTAWFLEIQGSRRYRFLFPSLAKGALYSVDTDLSQTQAETEGIFVFSSYDYPATAAGVSCNA